MATCNNQTKVTYTCVVLVTMLASLFFWNGVIYQSPSGNVNGIDTRGLFWVDKNGLHSSRLDDKISIHLVVMSFLDYPSEAEGMADYLMVMKKNLLHPLVHSIYVLSTDTTRTVGSLSGLPNQNKLVVSEVERLDKMRVPFEFISKNLLNKDVMFTNPNIFLGEGFNLIDPAVLRKEKILYSLTRLSQDKCAPSQGTGLCGDHKYMGYHDTFLFHLKEPFPVDFLQELESDFLSPGMEGVIMWLFKTKLDCCVLNPCSVLQTFYYSCSDQQSKEEETERPRENVTEKSVTAYYTTNLQC